jgi:hypothetical protein
MRTGIRVGRSCKVALCLTLAYLLSYYALLAPRHMVMMATSLDSSSTHLLEPEFHWNHAAIRKAFSPLLWLDQKVRPSYWCWIEIPEGRQKLFHAQLNYDGGFVFAEMKASNGASTQDVGFGGQVQLPAKVIQVDPITRHPLRIQWRR